MRIFADKVQLADNGEIEPGLRFNGEFQAQIDDGPRWDQVKVRDRMNERNTITFTVNKLHNSLVDCERFCLVHRKTIPRVAAVLKMICDAGGPKIELTMQGAAIVVTDSTYLGCTSTHSYQIVGGKIS